MEQKSDLDSHKRTCRCSILSCRLICDLAARRWFKRIGIGVLAAGALFVCAWLALPLVPLPPALFAPPAPQLEFTDRNGLPLRAVLPEGGPFSRHASYSEIPQPLIQATLAAEDRRFWRHPGVDWRATVRAAWQMAAHRRVISGGSTITQQLIKLAQPRSRTFRSKLIEAMQALRLEQVWDKQRILCEYFNRLDYGNFNRGCAAAAQFYFAKPLRDLSPAECALLAGLPQAPSRLDPRKHIERARKRQQWILGQALQSGWLTEDEYRRAAEEGLRLFNSLRAFEAPHFVDLVLSREPLGAPASLPACLASSRLAGRDAGAPSGVLRTTLDLELNRFVERTIRQHLAHLRAQHVGNAAAVVIENRTGDVLALVGSEDYFAPMAGQVNGAWAPRSAGSTFKPFTYLLALERGATPATVVADVPTEFATATGLFAPVNYNRHCYGPMRYRLALANSLNISAVKVLASLGGPAPLQERLRACGLTTLTRPAEEYGLGLTIGNAEARLLELANAYACLARLGEYKPYNLVLDRRPEDEHRVVGQTSGLPVKACSGGVSLLGKDAPGGFGPTGPEAPSTGGPEVCRTKLVRVAEAGAAYLIADILSDNDARALAFGTDSPLRFGFPVACKTGTSSDFRDNWAFGYTPEFTVGIWVGNFDGTPMQQVSGVTGAAPILHELFEHLHQWRGTSWYTALTNLVECAIDPITGKRLSADPLSPSDGERAGVRGNVHLSRHAQAVREKFLFPALPPFSRGEDYDTAGRVRLSGEYHDWLAGADNWLAGRAVAEDASRIVRIAFPPPGTTLYLDPDLQGQGRRLTLRAEGPEDLRWESDSLTLVKEAGRQVALLTAGRHQIRLSDPRTGAQAETWIEVMAR